MIYTQPHIVKNIYLERPHIDLTQYNNTPYLIVKIIKKYKEMQIVNGNQIYYTYEFNYKYK